MNRGHDADPAADDGGEEIRMSDAIQKYEPQVIDIDTAVTNAKRPLEYLKGKESLIPNGTPSAVTKS